MYFKARHTFYNFVFESYYDHITSTDLDIKFVIYKEMVVRGLFCTPYITLQRSPMVLLARD